MGKDVSENESKVVCSANLILKYFVNKYSLLIFFVDFTLDISLSIFSILFNKKTVEIII